MLRIHRRAGRLVRHFASALLALLLATAPMGCAAGGRADESDAGAATIDSALAVETFDIAWEAINDSHFDPTFNGVDWQAVRDELRPQAAEATTNRELQDVIQEMLSRLGQSHFALIPREAAEAMREPADFGSAGDSGAEAERADTGETETGDATSEDGEPSETAQADAGDAEAESSEEGYVGFDVRRLDGRIVVTRVDADSPAAAAGVQPGWIVTRVGSLEMNEFLEMLPESAGQMLDLYVNQSLTHRLLGEVGSQIEIEFLDGRDQRVTVEFERGPRPGEMVKFGSLPPMHSEFEARRLDPAAFGADIGLIRFTLWMLPAVQPFNQAVDQFRDADGMILDLRGNPGGVGAMAMGVGGHFFNERLSLGTLKTRDEELRFLVNPRRVSTTGQPVEPFAGPVAILIDPLSASTSEIFAGGMQGLGRVRIFGERSAGAALPARMTTLPNGDVLLHAFADFIGPSGESFEGGGVVPDEIIIPSREDLLAGRDPVLEAAAAWIAEQTRAGG